MKNLLLLALCMTLLRNNKRYKCDFYKQDMHIRNFYKEAYLEHDSYLDEVRNLFI